jgi:hypothetical protein
MKLHAGSMPLAFATKALNNGFDKAIQQAQARNYITTDPNQQKSKAHFNVFANIVRKRAPNPEICVEEDLMKLFELKLLRDAAL